MNRTVASIIQNTYHYYMGGADISNMVNASTNTSTDSASSSSASDASSHSGELVELPAQADIVKAMECPVCRDICVPPIWNCDLGHIICNTCRPQLYECALCKKPFSSSRNYALEDIAMNSKFQCQYKAEGCDVILLGDKYTDHVLNCTFKALRPTLPTPTRESIGLENWSEFADFEYTDPIGIYDGIYDGQYSDWGDDDLDQGSIVSSELSEPEPIPLPPAVYHLSTYWVYDSNGNYPENAVVGGTTPSGESMFVIRAFEGRVAIPGQLIPSEMAAYIVYNGTIRRKWYYYVLVASPGTLRWINYSPAQVVRPVYPVDTVLAQRGAYDRYVVARVRQNGGYICGNIPPARRLPQTQLPHIHQCCFRVGQCVRTDEDNIQILVERT